MIDIERQHLAVGGRLIDGDGAPIHKIDYRNGGLEVIACDNRGIVHLRVFACVFLLCAILRISKYGFTKKK